MARKPDVVADTTLGALGRKSTVRPGWLSKLLGGSLSLLPRGGRVRVMQRIMGGMSRSNHEMVAPNAAATQE